MYFKTRFNPGAKAKAPVDFTLDGKTIAHLEADFGDGPEMAACLRLPGGTLSSTSLAEPVAKEPTTGQGPFALHLSHPGCWVNDPNGFHWNEDEKLWHLCYQLNPVGREWGNLSWGHATSRNLVDWTIHAPVLLPPSKEKGVFSGTATIRGGITEYWYTLADYTDENLFTQRRAVSLDKGYSISSDEEVLGPVGKGTRDPKVFIRDGILHMLLFVEGNTYAIFQEMDGKFHETDRFTLPPAWECPDYVEVDGREFFLTADGFWWEVRLEDGKFAFLSEMGNLWANKAPYAAQCAAHAPDGRAVLIPWIRLKTPTLTSQGLMGLPRELGTTPDGKLTAKPVEEVYSNLERHGVTHETASKAGGDKPLCQGRMTYRAEDNSVEVNGERAAFPGESVEVITDGIAAEAGSSDWAKSAAFELRAP